MKQNADLLDRLQELIGQIHIHQVQANTPQPFTGPEPRMHIDEEEDDVMYQYRTGIIDKRELEEKLTELGFDNTSVELEFST